MRQGGARFGCLDLLGESGVPFWIQHPQDEGEVITDVSSARSATTSAARTSAASRASAGKNG